MAEDDRRRVEDMVEEGMPVQDAEAFVRKYRSSSSSSSSIKKDISTQNLEARLLKRLASQEKDEAQRISRLIRHVVGPAASSTSIPLPSLPSPPPAAATAAAAAGRQSYAAHHLSSIASAEVAEERAAAAVEARDEGAAAIAAAAAARSSVATYLARLEGVAGFMSSSFKFEPVRDDEAVADVAAATASSAPSSAPTSVPLPPLATVSSPSSTTKILGPKWTRGLIERPAGAEDAGAWRESV